MAELAVKWRPVEGSFQEPAPSSSLCNMRCQFLPPVHVNKDFSPIHP